MTTGDLCPAMPPTPAVSASCDPARALAPPQRARPLGLPSGLATRAALRGEAEPPSRGPASGALVVRTAEERAFAARLEALRVVSGAVTTRVLHRRLRDVDAERRAGRHRQPARAPRRRRRSSRSAARPAHAIVPFTLRRRAGIRARGGPARLRDKPRVRERAPGARRAGRRHAQPARAHGAAPWQRAGPCSSSGGRLAACRCVVPPSSRCSCGESRSAAGSDAWSRGPRRRRTPSGQRGLVRVLGRGHRPCSRRK